MQILKWFMQKFPEYVKQMRECSYHYDYTHLNLHHIEGDIWSHTVLAYSNAIKSNASEPLKWAILLHDIGRIFTRRENSKESEVSFGEFEGISCFVALEILNKSDLSANKISRILKIISYQYTVIDHIKYDKPSFNELLEKFKYEKELLSDLSYYVECDLFGRIVDESRVELYDYKRVEALQKHVKHADNFKKAKSLKQNTLYLLVGPPCSRKSSWIAEQTGDFIVVNRDSCVEEIGKKYGKNSYNESYDLMNKNEKIKKEIDALEEERENFAKNSQKRDIIIDNPNLSLKNRKEQIEAFSKTHKIEVLLFLTPFDELVACNKKRGKSVNKSVSQNGLINKLKTFTYPLLNEGIDEILIKFND
ncbi:MAG: AAA family ATPase [Sulfurimonas sp.]